MLDSLNKIIDEFAGDYTWVVHIFIIIFLTLLVDFFQKGLLKVLQRRLEKTRTLWDDALIQSLNAPMSAFVWLIGANFILLLLEVKNTRAIVEVGLILIIAWTLVRFISQVQERIIRKSETVGEAIDRTTADAIAQLIRLSVIITAILVGLQSLGVNISAVLAFGGIGGIAIGFAAKDLLANFFGGLMIYLDRPFAVGEWVRSPDRQIEGTVERIGWRLTVIRTFDKRPLYIPNSVFATISVENPSRMSHRRIYETIGVRYDDMPHLPSIVADVKSMLMEHEDIAQDQTMIVNFNTFGASSLDFFVYTFTRTTNWIEYHKIKQDVLFKISTIIEGYGAEIAFPTTTVHMADPLKLPEPEPATG